MRLLAPFVATAALVALTLTGCSIGALPGGVAGAAGGTVTSGTASNATVTGQDLITILKRVAAQRHVSPSISGLAQSKAFVKGDIAGANAHTITGNLTAGGGTFTPASCAKPLNALGIVGESKIAEDGWQGAAMAVGHGQISLGSAPSASAAAAVLSQTASLVNQIASQCTHMKVTNKAESLTFTVAPADATTDGDHTVAYTEVEKYQDGTSSTAETMEAVYGNLYIAVISTSPKQSELQANVNAVIAAAKG